MKKGTNHEISLDEVQLVCKALLLGISCCALNLVVVVVQAGDVCASELGNFSCWASNSTADVEDFVAVFDANFGGEVVFMAGNGLIEWFTVCETAEVE